MKTLTDLFQTFPKRGKKTVFVYRTGIRRFVFSYTEFYQLSLRMAAFLEEQGVNEGDRVIIWAANSPWWAVAFWGIVARGAVVVPVDFASGKDRAHTIARLSESELIIQSQYKLDKINGSKTLLIEDLQYLLRDVTPMGVVTKALEGDLVELVYTSGTTGDPKGVMLTHKNLITNMFQVDRHITITSDYNLLSVLPLSHMFEQMIGFLVALNRGATIVYLRTLKPTALVDALSQEDIYIVVTVPRLLQALKHSTERGFASKHLGKAFSSLLTFAREKPLAFKKTLFLLVHKKFGKNFQFFVSGGAALDLEVGQFWQNLGFTVIEGYGLTECSPVLAANARDEQILGTVGKPLHGISLKLAHREILAKGDNIFSGYWQNEKATKETFVNGWFRTGDEGAFDSNGNLSIKGRKKDVIVTAAGVNVYPDEVEAVLNHTKGVKEACVVGLDRGEGDEVHGVLLLDEDANSPDEIIEEANNRLDAQQQITGFSLWTEREFPKTPTLKIQKFKVLARLKQGLQKSSQQSADELISLVTKVSGKPAQDITEESFLVGDLGISSIGRLELVNYIEQTFRMDLEDTAINQHTKVKDLRRIIEKRERHDFPLKLSFYPNKPWAIAIRETTHTLLHRPIFERFIQVDKVEGIEHLKKLPMPVIFMTNHISYLDYVPIGMALPRNWREKTAIASREEFFFSEGTLLSKLWKRIMLEYVTLMGNVFLLPQKRGFRKSLAFMGKLIDNGISILVFPEGERSWDGKLLPFKAGLGLLVKELQVPVVPVRVSGMRNIFPRGATKLGRGKVQVRFGEPLYFTTESPSEIVEIARQALLKLY